MTLRFISVVLCTALTIEVCHSQTDPGASQTTQLRVLGLQYPRLANLAGVQGTVDLEAIVSSDGAVKEVKAISGHPLLVSGAKESLMQWRFNSCVPTAPCSTKVTFVFVLEKGLCDLDRCPNDIQVDLPATITVKSKRARAIIN